ncbi:hypothetical protein BD779DRAFT_1480811 [Infundibulicybe gibba]|nr:hypothetical protein BD779DRAFT_1480811 [Infundibulicybe gibba]
MVRPRKYHTAADAALANQLKSKKYYQKNQSAITAQRRTKYRMSKDLPAKTQVDSQRSPAVVQMEPACKPSSQTPHNPDYWRNHIHSIFEQFKLEARPNPRSFCDKIYRIYNFKRDEATIDDAITSISRHQNAIRRCHAKILQLDGPGELAQQALEVGKSIDRLMHWLEEILCYAMGDRDGLFYLYTNRKLAYQLSCIREARLIKPAVENWSEGGGTDANLIFFTPTVLAVEKIAEMARKPTGKPRGRSSWVKGVKREFLESYKDRFLENSDSAFYISVTQAWLAEYGYDLPFDKEPPEKIPPGTRACHELTRK